MDEPLYTIQEVAQRLKVTRKAVYDWMRAGRLRYIYVGERRRIPQSAIEAFVRTGEQQIRAEENTEENFMPSLAAA